MTVRTDLLFGVDIDAIMEVCGAICENSGAINPTLMRESDRKCRNRRAKRREHLGIVAR